MSGNNWYRQYNEFATDPKVQSMSEAMQRRLIMLFCLHSCNVLVTLHVTDLAFALRISEEELEETKALFIRKKFIDDEWNILNWDKRQYASDSSSERVRRYRERKRNAGVTEVKRYSNVIDTDSDSDTEKETDKKKTHSGECVKKCSPDSVEPHPPISDELDLGLEGASPASEGTRATTSKPDNHGDTGNQQLSGNVAKGKTKPKLKAKSRLKSDFKPPECWLDYALEKGFTQLDAKEMWQKFRDHHLAKASAFADWDAAWRTWVRNELEFMARRNKQ